MTEAKGRLESALVAAREMQSDAAALARWLDGLGKLGQQTLELEMSRMRAVRDNLNANLAAWRRLASTEPADPANSDPGLSALQAQIDDLNKRWDQLKRSPTQPATTTTTTTDEQADTTVSCVWLLGLLYIVIVRGTDLKAWVM